MAPTWCPLFLQKRSSLSPQRRWSNGGSSWRSTCKLVRPRWWLLRGGQRDRGREASAGCQADGAPPDASLCSAPGPRAGKQRDLQQLLAQSPTGIAQQVLRRGEGEGLGLCKVKSPSQPSPPSAPQETQQIPTEEVQLEVLLSNGQEVKVNILTSDQTEDVLEVGVCFLSCIWVESKVDSSKASRERERERAHRGRSSNPAVPNLFSPVDRLEKAGHPPAPQAVDQRGVGDLCSNPLPFVCL